MRHTPCRQILKKIISGDREEIRVMPP